MAAIRVGQPLSCHPQPPAVLRSHGWPAARWCGVRPTFADGTESGA